MSADHRRILLGFLLAPLAAPLVFDALTYVENVTQGDAPSMGILGAVFLVVFMAPWAYLATFCIGLPAWMLLRRCRALGLWELVALGATVAAVFVPSDSGSLIRAFLLFLPAGGASGLVLWFFVREAPTPRAHQLATR